MTFVFLISQWGSIDHAHHQHDSGEVCDYCIGSKNLEHMTGDSHTRNLPVILYSHLDSFPADNYQPAFIANYNGRAPPYSL